MFGIKKEEKINTDPVKINDILTRGIENTYPDKEFIRQKLLSGKVRIYLGIDPTGPTLHLGHIIPLRRLGQLQKMGHQIILLIGDFTGMIGDPTDKTATRKKLSRDEVLQNCNLYKKQASKFISFDGRNKAEFRFNSEWFDKMSYLESLEIASLLTVDKLLKRDMFRRREDEGKPVYLHEIQYPMMQGYDSVMLDADGEIGGNDQTFNMLAGRDLSKTLRNKEKFVLTMKLLTDSSGKKMGKTEDNAVAMNQSPEDMFGKVMSWPDSMIVSGFGIATDISLDEIKDIEQKINNGVNPKEFKIKLAFEIVKICHNEKFANEARENFEKTFTKGGIPEDVLVLNTANNISLVDILVAENIVSSKTEWRRLVQDGAVMEMISNEKITDPNIKSVEGTYKIGKRRFIKIKN